MENGNDWPTWIQAGTSVLAIFLAVFMPTIMKEVERRDKGLAIIKIFKLSIREVHSHVMAMGTVLQRRLGDGQYSQNVNVEVIGKVIKKLEPMVASQFELMRSVTAVDLPVPGMVAIPSTLQNSVEMLLDDIFFAIEKQRDISYIFAKYKWHQENIHELIKECDNTLDRIKIDFSPNPGFQMLNRFISRLRSIN